MDIETTGKIIMMIGMLIDSFPEENQKVLRKLLASEPTAHNLGLLLDAYKEIAEAGVFDELRKKQ